MPSAETDAHLLKPLVAGFGSLKLEDICNETLAPFVNQRKAEGIKNKSINNALAIVNRISRLAATRWRLENRQTWISKASLVDLLDLHDKRLPRPISWSEQRALLGRLPDHLASMALFCLSSGARKNVVCQLRWSWEVKVNVHPGIEASVFVVPRRYVKGRKRERVLFCNSVGQDIIESQRGRHAERVFTYFKPVKPGSGKTIKHHPIADMHNTAWQRARLDAGLDDLHVHDLRHTVGMRLRLAGVPERTQDEILWHSKGDMTTLYAVAQIREVYDALELIATEGQAGETINLMAIMRRAQMHAVDEEVTQKSRRQRKTA